MENSPLPVGMLSEEGEEARNKHYKRDRIFHARLISRTLNLNDVFCRALETSDPLISSLNVNISKKKSRNDLPEEVRAMIFSENDEEVQDNVQDVYEFLDDMEIPNELLE